MTDEGRGGDDRTLPLMRALVVAGAIFVLGAGFQLYVLTEVTDRFFAWTVGDPMAAATMGAFYLSACVVATMSAREKSWEMARIGIPAILVFLWLTLLASLMHLSTFHLDATFLAATAAYLWLAIYLLDPPLMTIAYIRQIRQAAPTSPSTRPIPRWRRLAMAVFGVPIALAHIALFLGAIEAWPWKMGPMAAKATAAWGIALGLILITAALDGDERRSRPASAGLVVFGLLAALAIGRYPDNFEGGTAGALWLVVLAVVVVLGGIGLLRARRNVVN